MKKIKVPQVFDYLSCVDFLRDYFQYLRSKNRRFSARAFCQKLGIKHSATLNRVLNGKRPLTIKLAETIAQRIGLSPEETEYFVMLAQLGQSDAGSVLNKHFFSKRPSLKNLKAANITLKQFSLFSDWYYLVILELFSLKSVRGDVNKVCQLLANRVNEEVVHRAVKILIDVELLKQNENGAIVRVPKGAVHLHTPNRESVIEYYHRQMLSLSASALDQFKVGERKLGSLILGLKEADVEKAKAILEKAHQDILALAKHEETDQVYILNTQFFPGIG